MDLPVGLSIRRAQMLRFALDQGIQITLGQIPADEFTALRLIQIEVSKVQKEEAST